MSTDNASIASLMKLIANTKTLEPKIRARALQYEHKALRRSGSLDGLSEMLDEVLNKTSPWAR